MTLEAEREERRCSRRLACFVRAGSEKGAACLTLRQLWRPPPPPFYTLHSVSPAPYLSALFVFRSRSTCPSSQACHHLLYYCFKGLKRVLETPEGSKSHLAARQRVEPLSLCITRICLMKNVCDGCAEPFRHHHSQLGESASVCFSQRRSESSSCPP